MYEFAPLAELGPHTLALTLVPRAPADSRASAALSLHVGPTLPGVAAARTRGVYVMRVSREFSAQKGGAHPILRRSVTRDAAQRGCDAWRSPNSSRHCKSKLFVLQASLLLPRSAALSPQSLSCKYCP